MIKDDVRPILAMIAGYWPTPALTTEEVSAWTTELVSTSRISAEEARTVIINFAETGAVYRPRPGQLLGLVQSLRRKRAFDAAPYALGPVKRTLNENEKAEIRRKFSWLKSLISSDSSVGVGS